MNSCIWKPRGYTESEGDFVEGPPIFNPLTSSERMCKEW